MTFHPKISITTNFKHKKPHLLQFCLFIYLYVLFFNLIYIDIYASEKYVFIYICYGSKCVFDTIFFIEFH